MEEEITKMDIVNKSKKMKYPNLSESINEELLNESIKDWVSNKKDLLAKKFGYEKKPTPEEIAAMEKAKIDEYMKQAQEMIRKGSRTGMDLFNKIWLANMLMNNAGAAKNIIKGFSNKIASTLDSKNISTPEQAAKRLNAINGQDAIKNFGHNILGDNINWFKDPKNFNLLNWKQKMAVRSMLNDMSDSGELSKSYDLLNNAKIYASNLGKDVKEKLGGVGDKIGSGAKNLWSKANELDPNLLKHLGYAGGAAALAGGVYLLGKNIYRKRKAKRSDKTLSENKSYIIESFNLPNLKKSKSDRLVFNKLLKSTKLSEASILAAYFSTPIGVRYGLKEGKKYFIKFKNKFNSLKHST